MTNAYTRAYTEVLEILSHFSKEEYAKIPTKKIEFYRSNMDKKYNYKNIEFGFEIRNETMSQEFIKKVCSMILITLFRDYFASEKQKIALKKLLNQNQLKEEQEKIQKYDSNSMFKDKKNKTENMQLKQVSVTKYEESFFSKIFNKIKKIFNK